MSMVGAGAWLRPWGSQLLGSLPLQLCLSMRQHAGGREAHAPSPLGHRRRAACEAGGACRDSDRCVVLVRNCPYVLAAAGHPPPQGASHGTSDGPRLLYARAWHGPGPTLCRPHTLECCFLPILPPTLPPKRRLAPPVARAHGRAVELCGSSAATGLGHTSASAPKGALCTPRWMQRADLAVTFHVFGRNRPSFSPRASLAAGFVGSFQSLGGAHPALWICQQGTVPAAAAHARLQA